MVFLSQTKLEEAIELLEDQIKIGNTGLNAEIYKARNILREILAEQEKAITNK